MRGKGLMVSLLALLLATCGVSYVYWSLTAPTPWPDDGLAETTAVTKHHPKDHPESAAAKARRQLLGVWQDSYQGKRTMTLNDDGTGTMLVELSGWQATLFAAKLRFDMRWSLADKTLTKRTVGGEPADKVNLILNTMGNTAEDTILEIGPERLLLLDKNGQTQYDWQRVKQDELFGAK